LVFSSVSFLYYFLPVFLLLYWALPLRNTILLLASLLFYAWGEQEYVALLAGSIALNYAAGLAMGGARGRRRRVVLAFGVVLNLLLLAAFKYANFLADSVAPLLGLQVELAPIHLPIGISFYTFQAISYLVDVHRGDARVERNPVALATYISMFPQLVAGPIVRFASIQDELHDRTADLRKIEHGIRIFVVGLAQKVLIANTVAVPVDAIYSIAPGELTASVAWLGMIAYVIQIYFDFAGYSNMAIGIGLMLGLHLPKNFDYPYISQSITEMWRRWHITLSTWFRDYVYIPLGGNRRGVARTYLNLVAVFLLCGLWHGAAWTFVVWGAWNGVFLVVERIGFGGVLERIYRPLRHLYVMLVWSFGFVIFRSDSLDQAGEFFRAMAGAGTGDPAVYSLGLYLRADVVLALLAGFVGATPVLPTLGGWLARHASGGAPRSLVRGGVVASVAVLLALVGMSLAAGTHNPFIYFRF